MGLALTTNQTFSSAQYSHACAPQTAHLMANCQACVIPRHCRALQNNCSSSTSADSLGRSRGRSISVSATNVIATRPLNSVGAIGITIHIIDNDFKAARGIASVFCWLGHYKLLAEVIHVGESLPLTAHLLLNSTNAIVNIVDNKRSKEALAIGKPL
jgi:hypothetical protein